MQNFKKEDYTFDEIMDALDLIDELENMSAQDFCDEIEIKYNVKYNDKMVRTNAICDFITKEYGSDMLLHWIAAQDEQGKVKTESMSPAQIAGPSYLGC